WSPSTSYRAATGSFPRRRNSWLTTSPTVAGAPSWPRCRLRGRLRHRAVESSRQRSAGGLFLCGAQAQEQRRLARRSKGRQRFLDSVQKQETVKSMVGGREMVVGRKSCLSSTMAGGRTPGGRCTSSRCVRLAASRHEFSVTSREARIVPTRRHHHQNG
ncbi:unnamed protein product, partial [Musa acuminata subsp. burmannicoides]